MSGVFVGSQSIGQPESSSEDLEQVSITPAHRSGEQERQWLRTCIDVGPIFSRSPLGGRRRSTESGPIAIICFSGQRGSSWHV
jgi:hypothetical protein